MHTASNGRAQYPKGQLHAGLLKAQFHGVLHIFAIVGPVPQSGLRIRSVPTGPLAL